MMSSLCLKVTSKSQIEHCIYLAHDIKSVTSCQTLSSHGIATNGWKEKGMYDKYGKERKISKHLKLNFKLINIIRKITGQFIYSE